MNAGSVEWLIAGKPRDVQVEALRRSYTGDAGMLNKDTVGSFPPLPHHGRPAVGWAHFMEMRLGKTATAMNEFMLLKRDYGVKRALVVCPNAFKHGWRKEAVEFGLDVPVHVYDSSSKKAAQQFIDENEEGMLVINYEALVHSSTTALVDAWVDGQSTMLIADESVKIKNHKSVTFKSLYGVSKRCSFIRILTGLPTPQDVTDLWSQLRLIRQLEGVNFYAFRGRFAKMGGFMAKQVVGLRNEDELKRLLFKCSFIAARRDWGGFIETDYMTADVVMSSAQARAYKEMEEEFVVWLQSGAAVAADMVISKHMKLQQISSGFVLDEFGEPHELEPFEKTAKFQHLIESLTNVITGKTIVVAKYRHTVDMLVKHLADFKPAVIRGAEDMKTMERNVEDEKTRFNTDPTCRVLVGQVAAIKYGHTLIGTPEDPCSTIVFYENSYSLDDRAQAEQRPQGFAQTAGIVIIDYASTRVERSVVKALQRKDKVAKVILGHYNKESSNEQ